MFEKGEMSRSKGPIFLTDTGEDEFGVRGVTRKTAESMAQV